MLTTMMSKNVSSTTQFLPSSLPNLVAWFRLGVGVTITGSGVSTWADQSGSGHDLLQNTDNQRPVVQGDNSLLFDGSNDLLACNAFTLNQPETIYILGKAVTWTSGTRWFDGNATNNGTFFQNNASPETDIYAGAVLSPDTNFAVGTYGTACIVFNGASSVLQINNNTPLSGNAGTNNMGGFVLAAAPDASSPSNIQVKEIAIYAAAHDAATRATVIAYMNGL